MLSRARVVLVSMLLPVLLPVLLSVLVVSASPARAGLAAGDVADSDPAPTWGWESVFRDDFEGPAGAWPDQWHYLPGWNAAVQNGVGQLDVGRLSQIRTTPGWTLPAGTQVRVSASILMPDTGSNYAALWMQHPSPTDPREIDVIESYGPQKPTGAQLGSHICYDLVDDSVDGACAAAGMPADLAPVGHLFADGLKPWEAYWHYQAEFTVGGDTVTYSAADAYGNEVYSLTSTPDLRRVPGNTSPLHLRLSNKDVLPEHVVAGGARPGMLVDWVSVDVKHP